MRLNQTNFNIAYFRKNIPGYKIWKELSRKKDNVMLEWSRIDKILYKLNYLSSKRPSLTDIFRSLNKFYFIGLTEGYGNDFLYFYNLLGIKKFYRRKHETKKSEKYKSDGTIKPKDASIGIDKILYLFYYSTLAHNVSYRIKQKDYWKVVRVKKIYRSIIFPFTVLAYLFTNIIKSYIFKLKQKLNINSQILVK